MAEADKAQRLQVIAAEIRSIPSRRDSHAERCESAGRLLIEAMKLGAFGGPDYAALRVLVTQRLEQHGMASPVSTPKIPPDWPGADPDSAFETLPVEELPDSGINGWISAWGEAVWWLRGKPAGRPGLGPTLDDDCPFVAELIDAEAAKQPARGPMGFPVPPLSKQESP